MSGLKKRSLNASTDRVEDDKQVTEKTLSRRGGNGSMSRAGDSAPGIPTADIITSADREGYNCKYINNGRQLENGRTLGLYGLNDHSTIHADQHLRSGDADKGMSRTASMDRLDTM